jgi:histone-binding protein RBBP4
VKFSNLDQNVIGTASDDGHFKIWDIRTGKPSLCFKDSDDELLVISFNHHDPNIFATGGESTGVVRTWDLRYAREAINDYNFHKDQVLALEWSPFQSNMFISGSKDSKVYMWDSDKTGEEQARHDHEDGSVELVFHHVLHQS